MPGNIPKELICQELGRLIYENCLWKEIDLEKLASERAIKVLGMVAAVLQNYEMDDFDTMEKIVHIFEANGLDAGPCHDFG